MQTAAAMLFLFLPAVLALGAVLIAALLVREAFASRPTMSGKAKSGPALPLLAGEALRRWAAELAQRIVGARMQQRTNRQSAIDLARDVESQTSEVIERSLPAAATARARQCNDWSAKTIFVTAPETLAMVEELRLNVSARELSCIRDRAHRNILEASRGAIDQSEAMRCPLLSDDRRCAVFAARPLHCRGRCCPNCDQDADSRSSTEGDSPRSFAATVGEGISAGLAQGLTEAGLDGSSYELNRALVRALETPDAAERWLRGEAVFEACR